MCGICGFIKHECPADAGDEEIIRSMNKTLLHRGPDAQDVLVFENVALGFSRLSIVGLENGMQPITNEDGSILLICNGEIFNYVELWQLLRSKGHKARTSSDVEVILHLYEEYGMGLLDKLNGQFAFALYDRRKKTLYCARDHFGIVPLFYTVAGGIFLFASEIKALLVHPLVECAVDLTGLDQVMTFAGLVSPRTMFRNIRSLENGHFLAVDDQGRIVDTEYWDLIYPEGDPGPDGHSEEYYAETLEELFEASLTLRLRADVPSGFYLSGGLDSSMIIMKAHQLFPTMEKEAFSIDFRESDLSEARYQRIVADSSNSRLHQMTFLNNEIPGRLRRSVYHSECPIKETYNTASLQLSESVRARGMKVIQSGEGADELFAGYVGYRFDKMRLTDPGTNAVTRDEEEIRDRIWGDSGFLYERNFLEFDGIKKSLYSKELRSVFDEINCLRHPLINRSRVDGRNVLNRRSYIDYKIRLVDHMVGDHGDRMALANSVEARYPFLDKALVEFSTQVPAKFKLNGFREKYILKRMASRFVPKPIIEREKFHFVAPGSPYLVQNEHEYINDLLSYDRIKRQGVFDPDAVEVLKNTYRQQGFAINAPFETDLLIIVITFGAFLDNFF